MKRDPFKIFNETAHWVPDEEPSHVLSRHRLAGRVAS
jgi:hypothetical protein